jgi:hypothetical protein
MTASFYQRGVRVRSCKPQRAARHSAARCGPVKPRGGEPPYPYPGDGEEGDDSRDHYPCDAVN